jgi:TonB family protein
VFEDSSSVNGRRSTQSLVFSVIIHSALVIAMFAVRFAVQSSPLLKRNAHVQWIAPVAPPPPVKRLAVRAPKPLLHLAPKLRLPAVIAFAPPILELPPSAPIQSPAPAAMPMPAPVPTIVAEAPAKPAPIAKVQVGGFSTTSTAVIRDARTVQTVAAGFGDAGVAPAVAARRSVSSGGFGEAGVASGPINRADGPTVRPTGGFGDAVSAAPSAAGIRSQAPPPATAAQILDKPRPAYTEEARRLEIEGEVQLEVVFGASGEVHILRVVRGLGHGLDENAVVAAKAIRFLPAKRDGHTVDSTAMVHIIFQLAS